MTAKLLGEVYWDVEQDKEGHRTYIIQNRVMSDPADGPQVILHATGLPLIGAVWSYGNDYDPWALCWPTARVTPEYRDEPGDTWLVEHTFSTRPFRRCQDLSIENPLAEPFRISGGTANYMKEVHEDRDGLPIVSSSNERLRGKALEFLHARDVVNIGWNVLDIPLPALKSAINHLNEDALWGMAPGKIKFSEYSWERMVWGVCSFYYSLDLVFEVDDEGWDKKVLDEGSKCLRGHSPGTSSSVKVEPDQILEGIPNWKRPSMFEVYKDKNGEPARVLLDGKGRPLESTADPVYIVAKGYKLFDFMTLGIPASLVP